MLKSFLAEYGFRVELLWQSCAHSYIPKYDMKLNFCWYCNCLYDCCIYMMPADFYICIAFGCSVFWFFDNVLWLNTFFPISFSLPHSLSSTLVYIYSSNVHIYTKLVVLSSFCTKCYHYLAGTFCCIVLFKIYTFYTLIQLKKNDRWTLCTYKFFFFSMAILLSTKLWTSLPN